MNFKIEENQLYAHETSKDECIYVVEAVNESKVVLRMVYPRHMPVFSVHLCTFREWYDQEHLRISYPLDLFIDYEVPRLQEMWKAQEKQFTKIF